MPQCLGTLGTPLPKEPRRWPAATRRRQRLQPSVGALRRAVRETEMIADPGRKPRRDNGDSDERRRQEEALDEALENTFPASDPVSVEQPSGRPYRS